MTGGDRMTGKQEQGPDMVRMIKVGMRMKVGTKPIAVVNFITLEGMEDDPDLENIRSIILAGKAQETPGMIPSLLGSNCSLFSSYSWSPF